MPFCGVHCGCAGLNDSLCPALSSVVGCCEGTSGNLGNREMVSTGCLPTKGRNRWLLSGHQGGGSSMGLDMKHQPHVASCKISSGDPYLLVQAMTT